MYRTIAEGLVSRPEDKMGINPEFMKIISQSMAGAREQSLDRLNIMLGLWQDQRNYQLTLDKFAFEKQKAADANSRALFSQAQQNMRQKAGMLMDNLKSVKELAAKDPSPQSIKNYYKIANQIEAQLEEIHGFDLQYSTEILSQRDLQTLQRHRFESASRAFKESKGLNPNKPIPRPDPAKFYHSNGEFAQLAYANAYRKWEGLKYAHDKQVYGYAAPMSTYITLPVMEKVKTADGREIVSPVLAVWQQNGPPMLEDAYSLIHGNKIAAALNTTWQQITATNMRHYIVKPSIEKIGKQWFRTSVFYDFTKGGQEVREMVPVQGPGGGSIIDRADSDEPKMGPGVQHVLTALNDYSSGSPLARDNRKNISDILEGLSDIVKRHDIQGAGELQKEIDAFMADPAYYDADTFLGKAFALLNPFDKFLYNETDIQERIQTIVNNHVQTNINPTLKPYGWAVRYDPMVDGVERGQGLISGLEFANMGPAFVPGPGGFGRYRAMPIGTLEDVPDQTGKSRIRFNFVDGVVYDNFGRKYPGLSPEDVREIVGAYTLATGKNDPKHALPLSGIFNRLREYSSTGYE